MNNGIIWLIIGLGALMLFQRPKMFNVNGGTIDTIANEQTAAYEIGF